MKRLLLSMASVFCLSLVHAQVPGTFSYQGILVDGAGAPVADGTHFVEFDFYSAVTAGTQLYDGSANAVTTYKGMFTFIIGTGTGSNPTIPSTIWDNQVYLEVTADAVVLSPRVQLTTNPYAFKAQTANTIVDNAVNSAKIADGTIVAADLASDAVTGIKILDGTIVAGDLATGSVTSAKILDGDIVNADINASAAIAGTKIAPNFGSQNVSTTGSVTATSFTGAGSAITGLSAANVTGTLAVANGGTGATTLTGALVGNGTGAVTAVSGTASQYFRRNAGNTAYEFASLPTDVTSVGLSLPSIFNVTGSPVTTSGTLTAALASQAVNSVFAAPSGSAGVPTFRALVPTDIPNLDAGKITTGTLPLTRGGTGAGDAATARLNLGLNLVPTSASNGLTLASNDVALGGTLTGNTTIASATFNLMFNGTGKFGIGSPAPLSKLSVGGNVAIGNTYADGTAAPNNGLIVEGNVGIGTDAPALKLDVNGSTVLRGYTGINRVSPLGSSLFDIDGTVAANSYLGMYINGSNAGSWPFYGYATGGIARAWTYYDGTLGLWKLNVGGDKLTVNGTSGNVGIGTTTPANKLDVEGGVAIGASYSGTSAVPANGLLVEGNIGVGTVAPNNGQIHLAGTASVYNGIHFTTTASGGAASDGFVVGPAANNSNEMLLWNNEVGGLTIGTNNVSRMIVTSAGNIGIGATPVSKLDVEGGAVIGATYAGTNTAPTNGLLVEGSLGLGTTTTSGSKLTANIPSTDAANSTGLTINNNYAGASNKYGIDVNVDGAGSGIKYGISSSVVGLAGDASANYGYQVAMTPNGTGTVYGLYSYINSAGTGAREGIQSWALSATGNTSTIRGLYGNAQGSGTGIHYGVYGYAAGAGTDYGVYGTTAIAAGSYAVYANGDMAYTGAITDVSDQRLKKNIKPMPSVLPRLLQLKPSTFLYRTDEYSFMHLPKSEQLGLIAQEIEPLFPEVVTDNMHPGETDTNGNIIHAPLEYKGVDYTVLIPVLIKATQEQQTQIEDLKSTISDLQSQLSQYKDLSAQVEELKRLMAGKDTGSSKTEVSGSHKK